MRHSVAVTLTVSDYGRCLRVSLIEEPQPGASNGDLGCLVEITKIKLVQYVPKCRLQLYRHSRVDYAWSDIKFNGIMVLFFGHDWYH